MTVIACGERRHSPGADGLLRFAIEDYLGAGAILSYLGLPKSSEAAVCAAAFESVRDHLSALLLDSTGGVELRHKGREEDVLYAARLDILDTVPVLRRDELHAFSASMG
jgi:2-phosphosulfolactate phosphatase